MGLTEVFADPSGSTGVTIAIIAGSFSLAGVLVSILLDKPRRVRPLPTPAPIATDTALVVELRDQIDQLERGLAGCKATRQKYRDWLIQNEINPNTGRRHVTRPRRTES